MLKNRVAAARGYLERLRLDALLFSNLSNIRYLTGFTGSEGALILWCDDGCFLTDSRYSTQAMSEVSEFKTVEYREKPACISSVLNEKGAGRIGFEAGHMTVALFRELSELLSDFELVPISDELDNLRITKDSDEIQLLGKAAEIASEALLSILGSVRPDAIERDLSLALEFAMRKSGADGKAFDFIIASGFRGALPHGKASEKKILSGELVTIDFGGVYQGYNSDETVTLAVGAPDSRQREIYQIVKDAHDSALEAVRPGISFKELDGKARNFIEDKGYGKYFGHGLGHGVGIDIHEKPTISFRSEGVVQEGMVFTIEPGIYIPGWGGVRIEDTVCVTEDGCSLLTKSPKDLLIL
jgi:Xaa-Pro aminopeptidase